MIRKADRLTAGALGLLALVVYVRTLCPTVYDGDSGELLSAIATLGVSHPTGFPLYMLLGKLAAVLLPAGNLAWRVNLLSAVAAAGAVAATALGARALGISRLAAAGAALFLAFSSTLWSHATAARVYALTAFFIAALMAALAAWSADRDPRRWALCGLLFGLGMGTHVTVILVLPMAALLIALTERDAWRAREFRLAAALAAAIGVSLLIYVPLAARRDPAMNWSDPRSPASLLYYLTQREYASLMGMHGTRGAVAVLIQALRMCVFEFTPAGFLLAVYGLVSGWRHARAFLMSSLLVVAGNLLLLMNYGYAAIGDVFPIERYFYPSYLVMALWIGFGLDGIRRALPAPARRAAWALPLVAILPLAAHFRDADRSRNTMVRDFGANLLATVPPNGILLTRGDAVSGAVWYLQLVEGARPDVVHLQHDLLSQDWYDRQMSRRHPEIVPANILAEPPPDRWLAVTDACVATRPVFSTVLELDRYQNVPYGPLVQLTPRDAKPDPAAVRAANERLWQSYALGGVLDSTLHKDVMVRELVRFYSKGHANLGAFDLDSGDKESARREFETAMRIDPENPVSLYNLGSLLIASGDAAQGQPLVERAKALETEVGEGAGPGQGEPTGEPASAAEEAFHSGIEYGRGGDQAHAIEAFKRAIRLDSLFAPAYVNLGTTYLMMQQVDSAATAYEKALSIEPGAESGPAYLNLGRIYADFRQDYPRAISYLNKFVELNPDDPRDEGIRAEIARLSSLGGQGSP